MDSEIFKREGIILFIEYQAFSPPSELASPVPSPTRECVPPPHLNQRSQFGRLERKRGTLFTLCLKTLVLLIRHEQELEVYTM